MEPRDWVHIALILLVLALFAWVFRLYQSILAEIPGGNLLETAIAMKEAIVERYGGAGMAVVTGLLALQLVITVIPSTSMQFVAGMIYGIPLGLLICVAGTAAGTAVAVFLSRLLGRRVITLFFSEKTLAKAEGFLEGSRSTLALTVLFLLPSPKDVFTYIIGLSNMKWWKYFLISVLGRIPGMIMVLVVGNMVLEPGDFVKVGIISAVVFAAAVSVVLFKNKLLGLVRKKDEEGA